MSDHRRRDHERRANQGDDQAAAHAIAERIRAGDLIESHVRLAARLGYVPAQLLFPDEKRAKSAQVELLTPRSYDRGLLASIYVAIAACILDIWKARVPMDPHLMDLAPPDAYLQALQSFVNVPHIETARPVAVFERASPSGIGRGYRWQWYMAYSISTVRLVASSWLALTEARPPQPIRRKFCTALGMYSSVLGHGLPGPMCEQQGDVLCRKFLVAAAVDYLIPRAK